MFELKKYEDELYHHGVKGMKWGVRRSVKKYSKKIDRQISANQRNIRSINENLKGEVDDTTGLKWDADTRNAYTHEAKRSRQAVDAWMSAKKDLMNMDISKMSKEDVKKRFEKAQREAGVYYPFG